MKHKVAVFLASSIVVLLLSILVVVAIRYFGDQRVAAFGSVMSFIAAAIAAVATVGYLVATFKIITVMEEAAKEQARVTTIMEADLQYRITPHLQFDIIGGPTTAVQAQIHNIGRGVATHVTGVVIFEPSNRQQKLELRGWIEPDKVRKTFTVNLMPDETGYYVKLTCTDSVGLRIYAFTRDPHGQIEITDEPHLTKI